MQAAIILNLRWTPGILSIVIPHLMRIRINTHCHPVPDTGSHHHIFCHSVLNTESKKAAERDCGSAPAMIVMT